MRPIMAPHDGSRMATLDSDIFMCCREVKTLGWDQDAQAKQLLTRAAEHVKPIMARRKWAVPLLNEFYPSNPSLLGLNRNRGECILVRLRRPQNKNSFFSYDAILHTLLHELCHIERGPHDAAFYSLLDALVAEAENIAPQNSEPTGRGYRLGDWSTRTVPRARAGAAAADAAARRARIQALMGSGRLGGDVGRMHTARSARELAVEAAERRRRDDVWCQNAADEVIDVDALDSSPVDHTDDIITID